ncbi:MAG: 3-phosphoshikimate 1-carboxyvinyltransferase [Saprospiraceae bacterium]|jgi:3-phosphoshikimate 1-carboxyvinyltransferase
MKLQVESGGCLNGALRVPGDKSISHRCIMLASLANGVTEVSGFLNGADALATRSAFEQMGVRIDDSEGNGLTIYGVGIDGLIAPERPLDLGNSGTAMRLMMGLMCGQIFNSEMTGDDSLSSRPMGRVARPLALMGANIQTQNGCAPLKIIGGTQLNGIEYTLPMASAQVKSAVLLAGLYSAGVTRVIEPAVTRDHTERMLRGFGYEVEQNGGEISLRGGGTLTAMSIDVPADISSAAFFLVGASIAVNSQLKLQHTGVNPTRDGVISILKLMGANIELLNERVIGGEPLADIQVTTADLKGIKIPEALVPLAIDEFPAIAIAAACAEGVTVISGAEELRVKECDRISATVANLKAMGITVTETKDGMVIEGKGVTGDFKAPIFSQTELNSVDDHRIAMAGCLAGLRSHGTITVLDADNVNTSFPNFVELMSGAGMHIQAIS